MPPSSSSGSGSDSEAPEAVALVHSKKFSQKQNADIRKAHALVREKTKLKNRQRDQKLKERAASNKQNGPAPYQRTGSEKALLEQEDDQRQDSNDAEARMLRAVKDAPGKKREDKVMERQDADADDSEGYSSDGIDVDEDYLEVDSGDQNIDSDPESEQTTKKPSNYLPDELFKAAFSQATKTLSPQSKSNHPTHSQRGQKKRKSTASTPKDVIVGSKAIRTLSSAPLPGLSRAAVPCAKIKKFLNRALGFEDQRLASSRGWERRPANIGVLRRSGPAAHFVRNR